MDGLIGLDGQMNHISMKMMMLLMLMMDDDDDERTHCYNFLHGLVVMALD